MKVVRIVAQIAIVVAAAVLAAPTGGLSIAGATAAFLGTSVAVASAIVATAVTLAGTLLLNTVLPAPKAGNGGAQGALTVYRQSISASFIIYGRRRAGGLLVFYHPKKVGKSYFRYFVIAVAGHRCAGVDEFHLGDEVVSVDGSGKVTSGTYANHAWLWFVRGTDADAAHATFVAECDGQWTTAHQGKGIAKLYAKFEMVDAVVQAGMPAMTVVVRGKDDIADPRTGTTGYTNLATPVIYDWFRMPREEGGFGLDADEVPDDATLAAWTSICDEDVDLGGGATEKRYELDVWMTTGSAPSEVRAGFIACCAGSFAEVDGVSMLRPGYWVPVSHSLSEDNLTGGIRVPMLTDPQGYFTQLGGTFVDPTNSWQSMPLPVRAVENADVDESDIDLPHVTSTYRGQRILEINLRRTHCEKRVTWPANIAELNTSALDTVQFATERYGLSNYAFVIDSWTLNSDFGVTIVGREENEDVYADPTIYGELTEAPQIAKADPIITVSPRAAYQIIGTDNAYPLTSTSSSVSIAAFNGTIDDGRQIAFPAAAISSLAADQQLGIFYHLTDGTYAQMVSPAAPLMGSSEYVFVGWQATATDTGTYTPTPAPPGGYGGGGRNPNVQEA